MDSRINKVLAMRTDSVAMLEALDAISEFYIDNTVEARRALRQDLELQNITLAKKFLDEFDQVRQRIEMAEDNSNRLGKLCSSISTKVSEANENMKLFMEKASELENRRNFFLDQSKEISAFLGRFQLSDEELDILYKAPLDNQISAKQFFEALQRLRQAYGDCKVMVEKHCYSAGFELLDSLGTHQDAAYQRLFDWVKIQCDLLTESGSTDDIDFVLQTAIRYLRKLPAYYSQCQDLVVNSRRTQLVQRFVIALTQGGSTGKVFRAIDLHAHDPVRYVGDMLAWMHQAVASEEEFLEAIFGNNRYETSSSSSETGGVDGENNTSNSEAVEVNLQELLARSLQGLGRPLRVRIVQTLESRSGLEILYTLSDLLNFYEMTFSRIVKAENAVHSAVKGCLLESKRLFAALLSKQADNLSSTAASYSLDLTASHTAKECCKQIQEILRVQRSTLCPTSSNDSDGDDATKKEEDVLGSIIEPLLKSCGLTGQSLNRGDAAIFMLNNVAAIQSELKLASKDSSKSASTSTDDDGDKVKKGWLDRLSKEALQWIEVLVTEEAKRTLRRSDLDKLMELVDALPSDFVASEQSGLDQDRVGTVLRAFYASLFSTIAPQFERLQDPDQRELTRKQSAEAVAKAHEKVYNMVAKASNKYDSSMLAHSPDEVRVLLGC